MPHAHENRNDVRCARPAGPVRRLRCQEAPVPATSDSAQSSTAPRSELGTKIARFAPTEIAADLSKLSAADRQALLKLVEASKIIDGIFLRQVWVGNEAMLLDLVRDGLRRGPRAAALLPDQQGTLVAPRSRRAVCAGAPPKPDGANFYPVGATKAEIEKWIQGRFRSRSAPAPPGSSPSSAARPTASSRSFLTASNIRTSSLRRPLCCARRRSSRPSRR